MVFLSKESPKSEVPSEINKVTPPIDEGASGAKRAKALFKRILVLLKQGGKLFKEIPGYIWELFMIIGDLRPTTDAEGTIKSIKQGIRIQGFNVWILMCSAILASIGLDINSPAVIIGAMLISPLMSPILGIGLAVGINDKETLLQSARNFAIAIAVALITSTLYFLISPLGNITPELEARTMPTLLDVGIAFFGGIAGIVAGSRMEKTNAIPGVAIATALMPPLCTAGFGLAKFNIDFAAGAFYLFMLNSVFISLATFAIVKLLKFPVLHNLDEKFTKRASTIVGIVVLIVTIPSAVILVKVIQKNNRENKIKTFLQVSFEDRKDCKVVNWKLEKKDSVDILNVTLAGENLPVGTVDSIAGQLLTYGIKNTSLALVQTNFDPRELDNFQSGINNEVRVLQQMVTQALTEREARIDTLNGLLAQQLADSFPFNSISKEVATLFPGVDRFGLAKANWTNFDSTETGFPTVMVKWKKRYSTRDKKADMKKLYPWLRQRLQVDTLELISY